MIDLVIYVQGTHFLRYKSEWSGYSDNREVSTKNRAWILCGYLSGY